MVVILMLCITYVGCFESFALNYQMPIFTFLHVCTLFIIVLNRFAQTLKNVIYVCIEI
jgi:hypothetical protein